MLLEYRDLRPQCLWLRSVILGPNSLKYLIHHDTSTPTLGGRVSFPVERNAHIIQPKQNTSSFCDLEVSKKIYNHQLRACSENSFLKQTNKQTNKQTIQTQFHHLPPGFFGETVHVDFPLFIRDLHCTWVLGSTRLLSKLNQGAFGL